MNKATRSGGLFPLCLAALDLAIGTFFPYMNRQMGPQISISEHIMAPSNSAGMKLRQIGVKV
jgi:hypothetical protein